MTNYKENTINVKIEKILSSFLINKNDLKKFIKYYL